MSHNVSVYLMFAVAIAEANMGRATAGASQIYCVRRAERSDSEVRVQRALRIFKSLLSFCSSEKFPF